MTRQPDNCPEGDAVDNDGNCVVMVDDDEGGLRPALCDWEGHKRDEE